METLKRVLNWLIASSADPKKTSLALKGMLTIAGGYVLNGVETLCTFANKCLPIDQTLLTDGIDLVSDIALYVLIAIGAVMTVIGLVRKAYYRLAQLLGW